MVGSFFIVLRANQIEQSVGDLGYMLGFYNSSWLNWKTVGIFGIIVGFLIAFGLLQEFFAITIGRLFQPGIEA